MTAPPVAEATQAHPLELSDAYTSVKDFLLDVQAVAAERYGVQVGYRKLKRIFDRWQWEDAMATDIEHGVIEGRCGQDRTRGTDPTGEEAVMNVMSQMLRREK